MSSEVEFILEHYRRIGKATLLRWEIPVFTGISFHDDETVWYHGQLLAANDCLYRSMGSADYLLFNDLDEFLVPQEKPTWKDLVSNLDEGPECRIQAAGIRSFWTESSSEKTRYKNGTDWRLFLNKTESKTNSKTDETPSSDFESKCAGFSFKSAFFESDLSVDGIPRSIYAFESDLRTKDFSSIRSKCLVKPRLIFEMGIHHVSRVWESQKIIFSSTLSRSLRRRKDRAQMSSEAPVVALVPMTKAFIHHYRKCVKNLDPEVTCNVLVKDESLFRFLPELRVRLHAILWKLREEFQWIAETTRKLIHELN